IIDKHGWTSSNRITRTQYQGYIRTVAIRLIFYCRFNDSTEEVTRFIGEGFEKLRYNAVEQYPHCGMLWAHVATCRNRAIEWQFMTDIRKIARGQWKAEADITEADRFPEIGNVCEQAQAAETGNLFWWGKNPESSDLQSVSTEFFTPSMVNGILRSSSLDMGNLLKILFGFERMKDLKRIITPEKWDSFMEKALTIMICYG
ncbi:hypothetical protein PFISCL1PPCAC_7854, partial [Pristionchus fissidentatus]